MAISTLELDRNRVDLQIRTMMGSYTMQPLTTEQTCVAFENSQWRVENNIVRNTATFEEQLALRIEPADDSSYLTVIIPVLANGRLLLLGRYRYALARWSIEFPRACFHSPDAGWKHAAEEHLLKDTGLMADSMQLLGAIQIDPALMSIATLVVLAKGCTGPQSKPSDAAELIAGSVALGEDELDDLMRRGEVNCGMTLSALCLYRARRSNGFGE